MLLFMTSIHRSMYFMILVRSGYFEKISSTKKLRKRFLLDKSLFVKSFFNENSQKALLISCANSFDLRYLSTSGSSPDLVTSIFPYIHKIDIELRMIRRLNLNQLNQWNTLISLRIFTPCSNSDVVFVFRLSSWCLIEICFHFLFFNFMQR